MIVVVEGPSATGKSTWVHKHHEDVAVWEYRGTGAGPSRRTDPITAGAFWADANARRWQEALRVESLHGLAVCDTDPLKLHYIWTLWRIGEASHREWHVEAQHAREMFVAGELGLADLFLVDSPPPDELRLRRDSDMTRRRHSFELHSRLTDPLREWYGAVDALEPGRVQWSFPHEPVGADAVDPRGARTGAETFDRLLDALPAR